MPRVRVPNASFIASADLPILPFLAPRVFAESLIPGRNRPHNARGDAAQKEKQSPFGLSEASGRIGDAEKNHQLRHQSGSKCRQHLRQKDLAAGSLQTLGYWQKESNHPHPVNWLYSEISSFARQHARTYATTTPSHSNAPTKTGVGKRRLYRAVSNRTSSVLAPNAYSQAARREKLLALERARISNYISRLPSNLSPDELMDRGTYRSLSRRVLNLLRWNSKHLDLTRKLDRSEKRTRLNVAFAALDRTLYTSLRRHTRRVVIKHKPQCVRLSRKLFPPNTPIGSHMVWKNWVEFDVGTRRAYAHRLLIYLLDRKPGLALRFIQVIANDPLLRGRKTRAIADALGHLSKIHTRKVYGALQKWGSDPMAHRKLFVPAFVNIFTKSLSSQPDVCSQDLLYNLVELAKTGDLKKVFDCLVEHRTSIGFDTMLHYASAFGEAGEVQYALKCLDELRVRHTTTGWNAVVGRERLRWTCATILRHSMSASHDFHQTPLIVAAFVRLGIKMDILLYNIVMHNAMQAGDYNTAFKVYNTLESNGLEPDAHTYSILLHGCTLQNDPAIFQSFAQHCADVAKQGEYSWLAADYLYYLYVRYQIDTDAEHTRALLWDAYSKLFSTEPLEPFIASGMMYPRHAMTEQNTPAPNSALLTPPSVALYIMMQTEIQSALTVSNQRVLNLYRIFKSVAVEGSSPAFRSLVRNPIIWNAFLLAFSQKQQFANASQVIKDMTESPTKPNIYSWNILMQAFFKTGQVQAAERVFEIMRNRGVDPDQFTYGILVRGYAKAQLVERIGETMEHLETEQELEPNLLRALAAVVNRRQLMLTLEKNRLHKEAKALADADQEAEEERARWEPPLFDITNIETRGASDNASRESQAIDSLHEDSSTSSMAPGVAPHRQDSQEADIFGFLTDEDAPRASSASSTAYSVSGQSIQQQQTPKQPESGAVDTRDPEIQYRMLQEQLGLMEGSESPVAAEAPRPEPVGASLGFKSVLDTTAKKGVSKASVPKGRVRPKIKRERLDRPWSD
ncbi:hypothetical protein ACJQWK_03304 [Exserohilum turcicum]|uniref:Pentatricopeptide repeat protein n=1 Tax=Exserohilum turcicum (strain 28A) TaxID=671987 RepID=R0KTQ5_EXST2|nr:uncharacterized protein SETTUDRAFT_41089 [Exserohilum turcica Et28A]EOA92309.1 hypothetical protein SETTUDRAFT_41089 [Exserohilum turcica Et28A]